MFRKCLLHAGIITGPEETREERAWSRHSGLHVFLEKSAVNYNTPRDCFTKAVNKLNWSIEKEAAKQT